MNESKNDNPVDEESAKLLADLEKQGGEKKAAPKKKTAAKKLPPVAKVEPALEPVANKADSNEITNTSKNPRRVGGVTIAVGDSYTLTDQDLNDESLMAKIDHSVKLGVLSRGAA